MLHLLGPTLCPSWLEEDKGSALWRMRLVEKQARKQMPPRETRGGTSLGGAGPGKLPGGGGSVLCERKRGLGVKAGVVRILGTGNMTSLSIRAAGRLK